MAPLGPEGEEIDRGPSPKTPPWAGTEERGAQVKAAILAAAEAEDECRDAVSERKATEPPNNGAPEAPFYSDGSEKAPYDRSRGQREAAAESAEGPDRDRAPYGEQPERDDDNPGRSWPAKLRAELEALLDVLARGVSGWPPADYSVSITFRREGAGVAYRIELFRPL